VPRDARIVPGANDLLLEIRPTVLLTDLYIALRNVLRHRRRSLMGIASIAFGIVALMQAAGFVEWVYWAMREDTIRSRLGHIQVVREGYRERGQADPFAYLLPQRSPVLDAIEALPHVVTVAPRLHFSGLASAGDTTLSFIGEGMLPERETAFDRGVVFTAGRDLAADESAGMVLGHGLARNLGAAIGDNVVLVVNTASGGINAVEGPVRGTFSTVAKSYDDSALRVPLTLAQQLLRVEGAHVWIVVLDDTARTDETLALLRARYGDSERLAFIPWYELADFYNKTVALFSKQVGVVKLIIAVIIVLSISNTLTMSVLERTGEIGTTLALGATRRQILRRFLGEGLFLGVIGGLVGLALGWLLALAISAVGIPMPPPPGMARGFTGAIRVTPALAFDAWLLAVLTTLAASVYPAWRASRLEIVDALRHAR